MIRSLPLFRFFSVAILSGLTFSVIASPLCAEDPATNPRLERAKKAYLKKLEKALGRNTTGPVVVALLETTVTRGGVPHTEGEVVMSMGREAAAVDVATYLAGQTPSTKPNTVTSRSFVFLSSFPPGQDEKAQEFVVQQQILVKQQLAFQEEQAKAKAALLKKIQSSGGSRGGRGGGRYPR